MKNTKLISSSILLAFAGCATDNLDSPAENEAISALESGSTAALDWQRRSGALLTVNGTKATRRCTGTIIGPRHVLTAASCEPLVGEVVLFYTSSSQVDESSDRVIDSVVFPAGVDPRDDDYTESSNNEFADLAIVHLSAALPAGTAIAPAAWIYPLGGDDAGFKVGAGEHDVNPTSAQLLTRSDFTYSDNDNDGHFLTENQQTDNEDKGGPFYFDRQVLGVLNGSAWEWANRDKYASVPERISFVVANNGFVWNGGPTMSHTRMTGTVSEMFTTSSFTVCRYACANTPGCSGVSLSDTNTCRLFSTVTPESFLTGDFHVISAACRVSSCANQ
jgi:hypothetical protein